MRKTLKKIVDQEPKKSIPHYVKEYLTLGFSVIPLKKGTKKPSFSWSEFQKRKMTYEEAEKYFTGDENIAIICGTVSGGLVVVDADTRETIQFLQENFIQFSQTVRVKTRRGIHFYFRVWDIPQNFGSQKIYAGDIKIDIKGNGGYVVAPPSVVEGHTYLWEGISELNEIPNKILSLSFADFSQLLKRIKEKIEKLHDPDEPEPVEPELDEPEPIEPELDEPEPMDEFDEPVSKTKAKVVEFDVYDLIVSRAEKLTKVKEVILKRYIPGHRQDICMYLAGWLRKEGFTEEEVEDLIWDLCQEAGDRDIKQRLSAVKHTFKEPLDGIKGISGLQEKGYTLEELYSALGKKYIPLGGDFYRKGNLVYYEDVKKTGIVYEMLGPMIEILARVEDGKDIMYEVRFQGKIDYMKEVEDIEKIRKLTGLAIISKKKYLIWLNREIEKVSKTRYIRRRTGWEGDIFYHPAIQTEDIWDEWAFFKRIKKLENEKDKQHQLIREALKEGGLLGFMYSFCLGSVLNEKLDTNPSVLFISGPARVGKTTLATLGINLFLPAEDVFVTAYTTTTGFELMMRSVKDLPILFDEAILKDIDLEKIVFMVASKIGKVRGTKSLSVNVSELNSNCIFTSEIIEQSQFKRAGAHRRYLAVTVEDFQKDCFSQLDVTQIQKFKKFYGAGVDVIRWILGNVDKIHRHGEIVEREIEILNLHSLWHLAKPILTAIRVWCEFFNEKYDKMYLKATEILLEQKREFDEKVDLVSRFLDEFRQFLVKRDQHIVEPEKPDKKIIGEIIGQREGRDIYILTKVFSEFCQEMGFEMKILIKELISKGILIPSDRPRKLKKILGTTVSVYHIHLPEEAE